MIGTAAKAKVLVFAVFVLGAVTGAVLENVYETRTLDADTTAEKRSQQTVQKVQDLLGLTPEQRNQWKNIVQDSRPEFNALQEENRKLTAPNQPKFDALMEKTRSKIRAILTDEQNKIYKEFNENQRKQREERARSRQQNQN
jgi:Spy/CpxP family protein refolding chaperone